MENQSNNLIYESGKRIFGLKKFSLMGIVFDLSNQTFQSIKISAMHPDKREQMDQEEENEMPPEHSEKREIIEHKIDEELEQSFPASDPPSYSQPGNDDIKRTD